jgi:TonB family protein
VRNAVVGSGLVHLGILAALFTVRTGSPLIVPGPEVVQVSLLDPGALAVPTTPPPEAPAPREREAPALVPDDGEGVKLVKPKPEPKKPEPSPEKPPEAPSPAAALPYAALGPTGLRGQVAVDAADFEFTYYLLLVRNRIAQSWNPPAGLATAGQPVRAVVYFRIGRGGELSSVRLEEVSGREFFDRSAMRAVMLSDPLPPLPLGFPGPSLGVHFGFEYQTP